MAIDLQNTIDTRTEGNTGGMSVMGLTGPQELVKDNVNTTTPVGKEVPLISTKDAVNEVQSLDERVSRLKPDEELRQQLLDKATKARDELQKQLEASKDTKESEDYATFVNPETGQETTLKGDALTSTATEDLAAQGYVQAEGSVSKTENPEVAVLKKLYEQAQREATGFRNDLENLAITSPELAKTIDRISGAYDARIRRMEESNQRRQDTVRTLGVRLGQRYTGGSGGAFGTIIAEEERQGLQRIADIETEKEAAIQKAEDAARDHNYKLYSKMVELAEQKETDKAKALADLEAAQKEQDDALAEEATTVEYQEKIISQIDLGLTNPIEIFSALNGKVPFDVIKEITDTLPEAESTEPIKLGKSEILVDPTTGNIIARGSGTGGAVTTTSLGTPTTGMMGGSLTITENDVKNMNVDERDFVTKVMRQLPTKLKDSEKEKMERQKEALFDFRRGRTIQEVVDEMNGYVIQDITNKPLANIFRTLAIGSDLELSQISAALNNNNPEQAMTSVENAKLQDADGFFSATDDARNIVSQAEKVLTLMDGLTDAQKEKMFGAYDGREFKARRFANLTNQEDLKLQQINTAMQLLNSPLRLALAGTAVTDSEFRRIEEFQTEITDQPDIAETKVEELLGSVLNFHNQARTQRGLPEIDKSQLTNNELRLQLYKDMAGSQYEGMSNADLISTMSSTSTNEDQTDSDFWDSL